MLQARHQIHIGTSGWYYKHWDRVFYPENVSDEKKLPFYAEHFDTVEINTTFYHLPAEDTVKNWHARVPKHFLFSMKASRYITHLKRLKDGEESLKLFYKRLEPLKEKLGPILFQLPPSFHMDLDRLTEFSQHLDKRMDSVFEFRHSSWFNDKVYQFLNREGLGLCITDIGGKLTAEEITSHMTYIRLHGPEGSYQGSYGPKRLQSWKKKILQWAEAKKQVFCYFDNDEKGFAISDAENLKAILQLEKATH